MREFVYYSKSAVTSGNFIREDLMKAGRMDIVVNVIIQAFFISNKMREDVKLHLIFDGPPFGKRHLIFESNEKMPISKKDVAGLIKRMLYKCPKESGKINEVFPGCFVEIKSFEEMIGELKRKKIFVLDVKGKDIRDLDLKGGVFVFGDQEGFPNDKKKFLRKMERTGKAERISVGPEIYFASQVAVLINNEIDRHLSLLQQSL